MIVVLIGGTTLAGLLAIAAAISELINAWKRMVHKRGALSDQEGDGL